MRTYLAQRAEIERMQADQRAQRERIDELEGRLERWNDPEYVIAQARARLQWVRPGELTYVVVEEEPAPPGATGDGAEAAWFGRLWDNLQAADNVTAGS